MSNKGPTIKILLIDDDEDYFVIAKDLVRDFRFTTVELSWVSDWETGKEAIAAGACDVYLVDYQLGAKNGLHLIGDAVASGCRSPLILLTSADNPDIEVAALKIGAAGFLPKGDAPAAQVIEHTIRYAIERQQAVDKLEDSYAKLRLLDQFKAELLGAVSHELRTPLAALQECISLVNDHVLGPTTAEQSQFLDVAIRNCRHLNSLVADLLDMASLEDGRQMRLEYDLIDRSELIREASQLLGSRLRAKRQILHCDDSEPTEPIMADRRRLLQVIMNLLTNASKFSPNGTTIRYSARSLADNQVEFCVTDEGMGLTPAQQERVFDKFYRVSEPEREHVEGTGIGLFLCRQIVTAHGGKIGCHSSKGTGTTFYFRIPRNLIDTVEAITEGVRHEAEIHSDH